jgi:hypothetical protein
MNKKEIISGVAFVIPLDVLRQTPSVDFHLLTKDLVSDTASIDRVRHQPGAYSPQAPGSEVEHPWYMHPHQEDNLLVMEGLREVELYTVDHGKIEKFEVEPEVVRHAGKVIHEGPAIFGWPTNVFHRIHSPAGSLSLNFARHFDGFDIKTNFNIYDLDEAAGKFQVIREGHLDQPGN